MRYAEVDGKVSVGDVVFGEKLVVMAGPCAVEDEAVTLEIARKLKELGVQIFRAGAFKPRTDPNSFQGKGEEGLQILAKVREETGMPVITEVMDTQKVDLVASYADILQIGARNMQNFELLKAVGKQDKPVMIKRGMSATLSDFLMAAEYVLKEGNDQVILCERGIRTFCTYSRNTFDLNIVPALRSKTKLPIIVDPSHGTGVRDFVLPMARAGIAAGADGLMIEAHTVPEDSTTDKDQAVDIDTMREIMSQCRKVAQALGKDL